jgi:hypothetical protein
MWLRPIQSDGRGVVYYVDLQRVEVTELRAEIKCCPACEKRCVGKVQLNSMLDWELEMDFC